jgi:hypothetical protein
MYTTFTVEKWPNNWTMYILVYFPKTAKVKKSPNRRKIAQSGYPDREANILISDRGEMKASKGAENFICKLPFAATDFDSPRGKSLKMKVLLPTKQLFPLSLFLYPTLSSLSF